MIKIGQTSFGDNGEVKKLPKFVRCPDGEGWYDLEVAIVNYAYWNEYGEYIVSWECPVCYEDHITKAHFTRKSIR